MASLRKELLIDARPEEVWAAVRDVGAAHRRLAYAATGGRSAHHHASMQVFPDGQGRTRLVRITDLLPDEAAGAVRGMVEQGAAVMKQALERPTARA